MNEARNVSARFDMSPESQPANGKAVVAGTARLKGNKLFVRVLCNGPSSCNGTVRVVAKARLGSGKPKGVQTSSAPFSLEPGVSTTLAIKLSRKAMHLLTSAKGLKARAVGTGIHPHPIRLKAHAR